MIHIEQGQLILENENLIVSSNTGDYLDNELIEFYNIENSDITLGTFQAQFIRYGSMVYKFSDSKELGEEILKIDPESTHTSASYVRMMNELLGKMNEGSLEPESLNQVISDEQTIMEEKREESPVDPEEEKEIIETIETTTETDENGDTITTTTTTTEEILPDVIEPAIETPVIETPVEIPLIEEPIIIPETPVEDNLIIEPAEELVSRLRKKTKIV